MQMDATRWPGCNPTSPQRDLDLQKACYILYTSPDNELDPVIASLWTVTPLGTLPSDPIGVHVAVEVHLIAQQLVAREAPELTMCLVPSVISAVASWLDDSASSSAAPLAEAPIAAPL